jgi:hypothetical protein
MIERPIRRRDLRRAHRHGSSTGSRQSLVWRPLAVGLVLVAVAAWWYADSTAFRRRAVTTAAVIDEVGRAAPRAGENGLSTRRFYGIVSYTVGNRVTRAQVLLYTCASTSCVFRGTPGDTIEIAYDPRQSSRAVMATEVHRAWLPSGRQAGLTFLGVVLILAAGFNLLFVCRPVCMPSA